MTRALRYRLFRIGRMPAELAQLAADPSVLVAEEGISVKASARSVRMPRVRTARGVSLLAGSIVVMPHRILASVSNDPILDTAAHDPPAHGHTLTLRDDGLHLELDVHTLVESGSGTVTLHFRHHLDSNTLNRAGPARRHVAVADRVAVLARHWA